MQSNKNLKIPKKQKQVTLWIHPEGRVIGSLFLSLHGELPDSEELPLDALNHPKSFLVLRRDDTNELRFYNKSSIVRVEHCAEQLAELEGVNPIACILCLMDGSIIKGTIRKALPPDNARLYDYLNMHDERFAEIYLEDDIVCLVNKSYIVYVKQVHESVVDHKGYLNNDGVAVG